jgi:protein ImuA
MSARAIVPLSPDEISGVWHADHLDQTPVGTLATGFAALDAVLPGGGWPVGAMTEILHPGRETHAWSLLLPALAQAVQARSCPVALVGPPHPPFGAALAAQGLPPEALLWVRCEATAARLWACEQALRCAEVAAVLAWLPQARSSDLRRLQLAAAQHDNLLWVFRPAAAAGHSAPARLRLQVEAVADDAATGARQLEVQVLKRRGPPLASPVLLPAGPARLAALLAASRLRRQAVGAPAVSQAGVARVVRLEFPAAHAAPAVVVPEDRHALDRTAVVA